MGLTDAHNMAESYDQQVRGLRVLIEQLGDKISSKAQASFSTALTDDDRRYLDLCAELHALESGGKPCEEAGGS